MTKRDDFLAAVRGIPTYHVAKAMTAMTPGVIFNGCTKARMAERYDNAHDPRWTDSASRAIARIDLTTLARRARARQAGDRDWHEA